MTGPAAGSGPLGLDTGELLACVGCGLCLPHCPTYRVTGRERASPRGRIAAMRAVELDGAPLDVSFAGMIDECVQCRGCEAACPSAVPYGRLVEATVAALAARRARPQRAEAVALAVVTRPRLLKAASWALFVAQRLRLARRASLPLLRRRDLTARLDLSAAGSPEAWLFTGCVMDAWQRATHRSALQVLWAAGVTEVGAPGPGGACCGALHRHAGRPAEAETLARRVMASMPGDAPIVVDSAGCGAALSEYGRWLGTPDAEAFSARVRDFAEFVLEVGPPPVRRIGERVVVQDPCHLRNVLGRHDAVHRLLACAYEVHPTDDDGLCCGAGGTYSSRRPRLARAILDRKVDALRRAAGGQSPLVASANPGCLFHLRSGGVDARHPADLFAAALESAGAGSSRRTGMPTRGDAR